MPTNERLKALEDRLTELEGRMDTERLGEFLARQLFREWSETVTENVNERISAIIKISLGNIQTMKNILKDLQDHFESHSLDKKKKDYASKRKSKY